jgi:hypothetical protein
MNTVPGVPTPDTANKTAVDSNVVQELNIDILSEIYCIWTATMIKALPNFISSFVQNFSALRTSQNK